MFRVYKDFIRQMLVICLHYRDLGYDARHAHQWVVENWWKRAGSNKAKQDVKRRVVGALTFLDASDSPLDAGTMSDLIDTCVSLLVSTREGDDRDLIDTIVRLLGLPYSRNTLAGSTLQHLRQALLLPEELADLKRKLEVERFCASCGHKFVSAEMTTYIASGDARCFYCTRCHRPTSVASDNDPAQSISVASIKGLEGILTKKHLTENPPAGEAIGAMADEILAPVAANAPAAVDMPQLDFQQRFINNHRWEPRQVVMADAPRFIQDFVVQAEAPQPAPAANPVAIPRRRR